MNDQKAILDRLRILIDTRKAAIRIRIVDKAFSRIAATGLCLMLLASTATAGPMRQVPPAKPSCTRVIYVVPVYRAPQRVIIYYGR